MRRDGLSATHVVLHYTAMESCEAARDWLCNPASEVSAHYLIDRDGTVIQMVAEEMRAWHAGAGAWTGLGDMNSRSIGIELANTGAEPFPEPLMNALTQLLRGISGRHAIGPSNVIGHSDMAPGRKIDPGGRFDWQRLALEGLAPLTPAFKPQEPDATRFNTLLSDIGYPEASPEDRLQAFRLRHGLAQTGPLNARDMGCANACASLLS